MTYDDFKNLKYSNLFQNWLEAKGQALKGIQTQQGDAPAYFLSPSDMNAYYNSVTPYDLYLNPNNSNMNIPSTIALAYVMGLDKPQAVTMSTDLNQTRGLYNDIPTQYQQYIPQAIYEHEQGHMRDPRLIKNKNKGYLMKYGMEGSKASEEEPAMASEWDFWKYIMGAK